MKRIRWVTISVQRLVVVCFNCVKSMWNYCLKRLLGQVTIESLHWLLISRCLFGRHQVSPFWNVPTYTYVMWSFTSPSQDTCVHHTVKKHLSYIYHQVPLFTHDQLIPVLNVDKLFLKNINNKNKTESFGNLDGFLYIVQSNAIYPLTMT